MAVKLSSGRKKKDDEQYRQLYREVKKRSQKGPAGKPFKPKAPSSRDYLASAAIGAGATPLALLGGARLSRAMHNRELRKALGYVRGRSAKRGIRSQLKTGPTLGPSYRRQGSKKPLMTYAETAGHGARGAVMGSLIQMLRDRFSG